VGQKGRRGLRRRQVFLFEELVVVSKARRLPPDQRTNLDLFVYKSSLKMSDLGLTAQLADAPLKLELWFRKRRPGDTTTLVAPSLEIKNAWTNDISSLLWRQATRNRGQFLSKILSSDFVKFVRISKWIDFDGNAFFVFQRRAWSRCQAWG